MNTRQRNTYSEALTWWLVIQTGLLLAVSAGAKDQRLHGELDVHDPSTIVKCDRTYWVFATGRNIISRQSSNLVDWSAGPSVFTNSPEWATHAVPGNRGKFWAPDVIQLDGRYLLYYSVSTWGSRNSAIGLASNRNLNPESPDYKWEDHGLVIRSTDDADFNTIDPCVMHDLDGRLWLSFGSFWSGIKLVELNPATGLLLNTNTPIHALAWKEAIEASCICRHEANYYLFVNWGQCCRGTNSTYSIRVGRSASITGPYVDEDGADMLNGGGTLLLGTDGYHVGPGHAGIYSEGGTNWLSCHYYSGRESGRPVLDLRPLHWNAKGWPEVAPWPND